MLRRKYLLGALVLACGVTLAPAGAGAAPNGDKGLSNAEARTIAGFYGRVEESMVGTVAVRRASMVASAASPVHRVANEMDRPDAELYPVSVHVSGRKDTRLSGGVVRSCARWTTSYNTGPDSVTDTCWDLTVKNGVVSSASPYGTDQILAESSDPSGSVATIDHRQPASTVPDGQANEVSSFAGWTYADKAAIANYALTHALSPNPSYRTWPQDCTNFVSQAAAAGGWRESSGWYKDDTSWWYGGVPDASWTWTSAEYWYRFARVQSQRAGIITNVWHLNPGDVLQYKNAGSSIMNHSMVTTYRNGSDIRLSYHTTNTKNKPLKDILTSDRIFFAHAM